MPAVNGKPNDIARVSHHFSNVTQSYCQINFFYHMYGAGMGSLRMFVELDGGGKKEVMT